MERERKEEEDLLRRLGAAQAWREAQEERDEARAEAWHKNREREGQQAQQEAEKAAPEDDPLYSSNKPPPYYWAARRR